MEIVAWITAICGLGLGSAAVFVPGFPGCAVALLGLVGFAGLTGFEIVGREAVVLASIIALVGVLAQVLGPALSSRALAGSAGAATGAAIGAVVGIFVPIPGVSWGLGVLGALVLGATLSRERVIAWLRGLAGAVGGCCVAAVADAVAVLGVGAVLGLADFVKVSTGG